MKMNVSIVLFLFIVIFLAVILLGCKKNTRIPVDGAVVSWAGLRSSSYGIKPFPSNQKWMEYAEKMEDLYPGSVGSFVWIVGNVTGNGTKRSCTINFPLDSKIEGVNTFPIDQNEDFLTMCDDKGYAVWLQVEPGYCDLPALAEATMRTYSKHPSVRGFGVDVEWYRGVGTNGYGEPFTDELAKELDQRIKKVNSRYTYFLKHWDEKWLPPTYRSDLIFVNDSQGHANIDSMKKEFSDWTSFFYPNPVFFQIGYEEDESVWKSFDEPVKELGAILAEAARKTQVKRNDQEIGIIWVDFTLKRVMEQYGK